jgi:hypothetical protein
MFKKRASGRPAHLARRSGNDIHVHLLTIGAQSSLSPS